MRRPARGKPRAAKGYGGHIRITLNDFADHLFGGTVFAVACLNEDGCNFLAFDCDENFAQRLPIYAKVLERRGLSQAGFATSGSTAERGKVVLTLARRIPQAFAISLAKDIEAEAVADDAFGNVRPNTLTRFPSGGDGSYCRIGGSKHSWSALERIIGFDGEPTDLVAIAPALIQLPASAVAITSHPRPMSSPSAWAQTLLSQPFTGTEPDLLRAQLRLAAEAIRIFGEEAGAKFREWMEVISKNSPTLSGSTQRQLFRADAFPRAEAYIARVGLPKSWEPLKPPYILGVTNKVADATDGTYKVACGGWRVYTSLATYVLTRHLDPHCLSMDYKRVADLSGYADKTNARRDALQAEFAQLLRRLDPGRPRARGRHGISAVFCLRGEGETMDEAIAAGQRSRQYLERHGTAPPPAPPNRDRLGALRWGELRETDRELYDAVYSLLSPSRRPVDSE